MSQELLRVKSAFLMQMWSFICEKYTATRKVRNNFTYIHMYSFTGMVTALLSSKLYQVMRISLPLTPGIIICTNVGKYMQYYVLFAVGLCIRR